MRKEKHRTARQDSDEILDEALRTLRKKLANEQQVPPYIIFSDVTLEELIGSKPTNMQKLKMITGIGEKKAKTYGTQIIDVLLTHLKSTKTKHNGSKDTRLVTYAMYKQGNTVYEIARERNLSISTVYGHLAELCESGHDVDLSQFLQKHERQAVFSALDELGSEIALKPLYKKLGESIDYNKLKLAKAMYRSR